MKKKKEDDPGQYKATVRELEETMSIQANRNQDEPPRVIRRARTSRIAQAVIPYSSTVTGWDIRGGNLELFYAYGVDFG